ncbi:MAG: glycosyltransferase [Bacteroidetes bacterium]|nr:glycosyltransferase [Bacteroidota bacterium]
MKIVTSILYILEWILLGYFMISVLYLFFFSIVGLLRKKSKYKKSDFYRNILVLIPAFKEDLVIDEVVEDALKQEYPASLYHIKVIADSLLQETLKLLKKKSIDIVEVSFASSTKSKAIRSALESSGDDFNVVIILDADNIMAPDFLSRMNNSFANGYKVIQGHRIAKNTDTNFALMDAISEEINNHIFRQGHRAVGLSSALIGSAMGFDFQLFKQLMDGVEAIGGFDKELELKIAKEKIKIEYLNDAIVLDEKVQNASRFTNQRRRWLAAQFFYFKSDIIPSFIYLITKGNIEYFNKAFQFLLPPRILLLGTITLINIFIFVFKVGNVHGWLSVLILTYLVFLFSIPFSFYNLRTLKVIFDLPRGYFWMIISLLKSKNANREFIHTVHENKKQKN